MRLNFLYIANIRLPTEKAHGIQIMKTCEALARQGIEVELIVPRRLNHIKQDTFEFYNVEKNFKITKVWCLDLISLNIFGAVGFWLESWTFYHALKKYLRGQDEAVYYTRDLSIAYWLSKDVSSVYYEIHTLPDRISFKYEEAWDRCSGLIVISNGLKNEIIKQGVSENKILLARDAVDLQEFVKKESKEECRKKLNLPMNQKIVVYAGHLYEWKGAGILAEATKRLPVSIQVYLVGGMSEDIKKFKQTYPYTNLHIVGWQKHEMIPYWLKAADLLVLPTSAKEKIGLLYSSPMKLFEYLASGTPIVAARTQSLQEILQSNQVTFFEADNAGSLADKIIVSIIQRWSVLAHSAALLAEKVALQYSWKNRAINIKNFICQK